MAGKLGLSSPCAWEGDRRWARRGALPGRHPPRSQNEQRDVYEGGRAKILASAWPSSPGAGGHGALADGDDHRPYLPCRPAGHGAAADPRSDSFPWARSLRELTGTPPFRAGTRAKPWPGSAATATPRPPNAGGDPQEVSDLIDALLARTRTTGRGAAEVGKPWRPRRTGRAQEPYPTGLQPRLPAPSSG